MADENTQSTITTPLGSVQFNGKKTAEFIAILSLGGLIFMGTILWQHKDEAKAASHDLREQLQRNSDSSAVQLEALKNALHEQARQTKLQTCILSYPQDQRQQQFDNPNSVCNRIAR